MPVNDAKKIGKKFGKLLTIRVWFGIISNVAFYGNCMFGGCI